MAEQTEIFKALCEVDRAPVVICDMEHTIIYMNPSAEEEYKNDGGKKLIGSNLLNCHSPYAKERILQVVEWFKKGKDNNIIFTFHSDKENKDIYMVALRNEKKELIGYYEKHESRNLETMTRYDFK